MKKIIFFAMMAIMAVTATAQHYRGFADFTVTYPVSNTRGFEFEYANGLTIGATTSHGVQINKLFVGAGTGALFIPSSYGIGLPVFAEGRWDFFKGRTVNFFAGVKLGYIFAIGENDVCLEPTDEYEKQCFDQLGYNPLDYNMSYGEATFGSVYFQPSIGVRFRMSSTIGINLALSYLPLRFNMETYINTHDWRDEVCANKVKVWSHRIALSIGLDF